jgi:hypothetical protein
MKVYRLMLKGLNYFSKLANFTKTVENFFDSLQHKLIYEPILVVSQNLLLSRHFCYQSFPKINHYNNPSR